MRINFGKRGGCRPGSGSTLANAKRSEDCLTPYRLGSRSLVNKSSLPCMLPGMQGVGILGTC
jgi:hypothetical protein